MAEASDARTRFQMVGSRAAVLEGPIAGAIEQQIHAFENALESVPDFAFDLAKTLVESVCKTVLEDIGQPADPNWDAPKLLKETDQSLALLPRNHPDPCEGARLSREDDPGTAPDDPRTLRASQRLRHGSHGRDGFSARLDLRQATLAAQAADTIVLVPLPHPS